MAHYICTGGCAGVSEEPGTCQATDCDNWGEELEQCSCKDGSHQPESTEEGEKVGEEE